MCLGCSGGWHEFWTLSFLNSKRASSNDALAHPSDYTQLLHLSETYLDVSPRFDNTIRTVINAWRPSRGDAPNATPCCITAKEFPSGRPACRSWKSQNRFLSDLSLRTTVYRVLKPKLFKSTRTLISARRLPGLVEVRFLQKADLRGFADCLNGCTPNALHPRLELACMPEAVVAF